MARNERVRTAARKDTAIVGFLLAVLFIVALGGSIPRAAAAQIRLQVAGVYGSTTTVTSGVYGLLGVTVSEVDEAGIVTDFDVSKISISVSGLPPGYGCSNEAVSRVSCFTMFPASGLQGALFGQLQIETSKVPAGSYVLVVTATDTATGRSASATATLRIVYGTYSETVVHSTAHINWIARSDIYGSYQSGFQAFFDFADSAYTQIEQFLAISSPVVPLKIRVTDSWGYGASASYGELELSYAMLISSAATAPSWIQSFPRPANEWAYGVIVHEMVNVFSGSVTRDWPTDWWADTRSPFPAMVAVKVLEALGQQNFAIRQDAALGPDPLYQMFKHFQETYGWTMFQRAFSMMRSDEIDLSQIGQNPSVLKAHYVAFYLSEGAGTDLCVCVLCSFFSVFFLMPCACV